MAKNKIPLLTNDLRSIINEGFPADKQLIELKEKMDAIHMDVLKSMEAIEHLQYLRIMKIILSN